MAKKTAGETETTTPAAETISKSEAVRRALADGIETPADGVQYLKDKYGLEMTNQQFSTLKSIMKKKTGSTPARRGPKPGKRKAGNGVGNGSPAAEAVSGGGLLGNGFVANGKPGSPVDLARAVKQLVGQYGAADVSEMVTLFAE